MRIFALFYLCPFLICAQPQDLQEKSDSAKTHFLSFDLLSPLNDLNPRWRIGYIQKIDYRWQIAVAFGFGNKNVSFKTLNHNLSYQKGYELFEVRPEVQYTVFNSLESDLYVAASLFYIHHKDVLENRTYLSKETSEYTHFERANFRRQKYGLHILAGIWVGQEKRVSFNFYLGAGIRVRSQEFSNIINPINSTGKFGDFAPFVEDSGYRINEGSIAGFDFILGTRIALSLQKTRSHKTY